jgi:hypothetical protein
MAVNRLVANKYKTVVMMISSKQSPAHNLKKKLFNTEKLENCKFITMA